MNNFKERLKQVRAFVFDVDGVLTGRIYLMPNGELARSLNMKDGYAIQLARKKKFPIAIITGAHTESVKKHFNKIGLLDVFIGSANKKNDFENFCSKYNLDKKSILTMGDDIPDYEILKSSGIATCPADASEDIKQIVDYVSHINGGEGCVRDIIEQVLRAQNFWMNDDAYIW
ncbi:MAG: HAD-IIIA family hydrolase [Marinilabiliales bacterium]